MKNFTQNFIGLLALVCIMTANLFAQTPGQFCTINVGSIVGDVYGTYDCGGNCVPNGADISACVFFQYDINASYNSGYSDGEASVTPDDGVNQSDVDGAYFIGFGQGVASVEITECEEVSSQNIPLYLSEGWSMFGYTCLEPIDAIDGFIEIADNISIVKDYLGNAYLPEWGFNGIGSFEFARGYQIKMLQEVTDFQFCTTIAGGASQEELDAAYAEGAASVTPEDGITQADLVALAESYEGYTAPLNIQIGDLHAGGIVFQINENGSGLVAAMEDLTEGATDFNGFGEWDWGCFGENIDGADSQWIGSGLQNTMDITNQGCTNDNGLITPAQAALDAEINGYSDWYLPSQGELYQMYITIGQGSENGNTGGFEDVSYWSSSEDNDASAWSLNFVNGTTMSQIKFLFLRVRVIRAF